MERWIELRRTPQTIGTGRGFVIPKKRLFLKSNMVYIIKIISEEGYHAIPTDELRTTKRIGRVKTQQQIKRGGIHQRNTQTSPFMGVTKIQDDQHREKRIPNDKDEARK